MFKKYATLKKRYRAERTKRHNYYRNCFFEDLTSDELLQIDTLSCISEKHRFFYNRIPKAANSTIMNTLAFATLGKIAESRAQINKLKAESFLNVTDTKLTFEKLENLHKFTFVRNPADRIVSAFNHKIIDVTGYERQVAKRDVLLADDPRRNSYLFDIFLEKLGEKDYLRRNYHWAPQVRLLLMPIQSFNFIGTVECLETDLRRTTEHIFGKAVPIYNWVEHSTSFKKQYVRDPLKTQHLNKSQQNKLSKIYFEDFNMFELALEQKRQQ
jgi:hypothetical protein